MERDATQGFTCGARRPWPFPLRENAVRGAIQGFCGRNRGDGPAVRGVPTSAQRKSEFKPGETLSSLPLASFRHRIIIGAYSCWFPLGVPNLPWTDFRGPQWRRAGMGVKRGVHEP